MSLEALYWRAPCVSCPTHFGHGLIGNCLTPLLHGADLYLCTDSGIQTTRQCHQLLVDNDITFMSSVPYFWHMVLKLSPSPATPTLKRVHIGSAPLSAQLWQSVQEWTGAKDVNNLYGITETANWFSGGSGAEGEPGDGWVGRPWGGHAAVLDDDGEMHSHGEGELILQTPSLMKGYLNRDDLTDEVVRGGWFHSGDHGHIDTRGNIHITGRLKSEINRAGSKIHPEEIDLLLERHADVVEACTFGIPDPRIGETIGIAIVPGEGVRLDENELRDWCRQRVRPECIPDRWFFLENIPRSERGKVDRNGVGRACLDDAESTN